jgi:hypothetical protein
VTLQRPAGSDAVRRRAPGFTVVLAATAIGGAAGYFVTWLIPAHIGFAAYAPVAVFWALLFLVVSALSGIQQEVTRASIPPVVGTHRRGRVAWLPVAVAAVVAITIMLTAHLWLDQAFPAAGWGLVWPLTLGTASFVMSAFFAGALYSSGRWRAIFVLIVTEALARLVMVAIALVVAPQVEVIAWAVALPIPFALAVLARPLLAVLATLMFDVRVRALLWNFVRTVASAASMGVLVSGLPFVLGLNAHGVPARELGMIVSAMTLTRAPLIVVTMSLQSYILTRFKADAARVVPLFWRLIALLGAVGVVLGALAYTVGPTVFDWLFPREEGPSGALLAALVASSALVGMIFISAAAVLAQGQHAALAAGWLAAAFVTVAALVMPLDFESRVILAIFIGPCVGLAIHAYAFFSFARRDGKQTAAAD